MIDRYTKKDVLKKMITGRNATGYDYYFKGSRKFAKDNTGPWSSRLETTQVIPPKGK